MVKQKNVKIFGAWTLRSSPVLGVVLGAVLSFNGTPVRGELVSKAASAEVGVYRWGVGDKGVNIPRIAEFGKWLGISAMPLAEEFTDNTRGWDNMEGPGWDYGYWQPWLQADSKRNLVLSYQMIPGDKQRKLPDGSTVSWAACGKGDYNSHYTAFAHSLMSYSVDHAYIRLAWEMDGDWYGSRVDTGEEADFAACFRQVVTTMRTAEPKSAWKFVINPTQDFHFKKPAGWFASVYPGDDVVDVIGIDLYDQTWDQNAYPYPAGCDSSCMQQRQEIAWKNSSLPGLTELSDFAKKHGKPFAFPEWGLVDHVDGVQRGGLDNSVYIQHMYDWMADPANNVAFQVYFDIWAGDGNHNISGGDGPTPFPSASLVFKKLFSQGGAPLPVPSPAPTSVPTQPYDGKSTVLKPVFNVGSCLDIQSGSQKPSAGMQEWVCHGGKNQLFSFSATQDGYYTISAASAPSLCLDGQASNTGQVLQGACTGGSSQKWSVAKNQDGSFSISLGDGSACMDVYGSGLKNGTWLGMYSCHKGQNQRFQAPGF